MRRHLLSVLILLLPLALLAQSRPERPHISTKPFVLGETRTFRSSVLDETRTLNIYLPAGYGDDDTTRYPVVYLLDGAADEDFLHIAGLYQFSAFPWVDRAPPSIVVGIANTDRRRDFTFPTTVAADKVAYPTTGGSEKFIRFLEEELQPHIDVAFRTATQRTIIGQSLGGLLAAEILLKKPRLFTDYLIVSPSLWWSDGALLKASLEEYKKASDSLRVFIAVGKEGLTPGSTPRVMEVDVNFFADQLKEVAARKSSVYLDYLPDENHATILHMATMNGLKWLHAK